MSLMDTLTPQTFTPTGGRKVLNMSKRDDAEDKRRNEEMQKEMDLKLFLKRQSREQAQVERRNQAIRSLKIRKLRDAVKRAKGKWELAVKSLEEALNETLPRN